MVKSFAIFFITVVPQVVEVIISTEPGAQCLRFVISAGDAAPQILDTIRMW